MQQNQLALDVPLDLRHLALLALKENTIEAKLDLVHQLSQMLREGSVAIDVMQELTEPANLPGRPALPKLISPRLVPKRSAADVASHAAMVHAVVHIEFNAVNLALDAVWRFGKMPENFYRDWLQVAAEEALHFTLLREHLRQLGYDYGSFDAHDGLWEMAAKTRGDLLARMALVPRTLEARGLDVNPGLVAKFIQANDHRGAEILELILRDEIGHVAVGNRWYRYLCERSGVDEYERQQTLRQAFDAPKMRAPINVAARKAAGFSDKEIQLCLLEIGQHK